MQVAAIQHDIVWQNATATRQHLEPIVARAASGGARLIVLSEMFATGFSMRPEEMAEERGGPTERWLAAQAEEHSCWIVGSIAQHDPADADGRAVNVAVLAGPDGQNYRYEKMHPFTYAGENIKYRPGDKPLTVTIEGVRTSVFICYDLRFADDFWALAHDTDLFVVPANWPEARREHWQALLRARAIENQAYVVGVNRVGRAANDVPYAGDSAIIDPLGRVLAQGSVVETVLVAEVTAGEVAAVRTEFPFLEDRR